jgi:hypothetical protein
MSLQAVVSFPGLPSLRRMEATRCHDHHGLMLPAFHST